MNSVRESAPKFSFYFPILGTFAFLLPTTLPDMLPEWTMQMRIAGCASAPYLGPLFRDPWSDTTGFHSSVTLVILYFLCGFIGLLSASILRPLTNRINFLAMVGTWCTMSLVILFLTGLIAVGPVQGGVTISHRTLWGAKLSDFLPKSAIDALADRSRIL